MKDYFTIYTLLTCDYCKKACELLIEKNLPFLMVVTDKNKEFLDGLKNELNHNTVPIVVKHCADGTTHFVGGFDSLEQHLKDMETKNG
mgnify:CR=1 FL=1